jgi:hypothetical protein
MLEIGKILLHGAVLSVPASLVLMAAVYFNPRFARQNLPMDIQDATPPLSKKEKLQALAFGIPFFVLVVLIPFLSGFTLEPPAGGQVPFLVLFLHIFGVIFVFSLFDLIILDCLIYCTITPKFVIIPGTEGFAGYKDYGHQARAHVRGIALQTALALLLAGVILLIK